MIDKLFVAMKAIISYQGKILLLRESSRYGDGSQVGKYGVVGGRIEPGEAFDDALLREVMEETGLTVEIGKPITVQEWRPVVRKEQWQIVGTFFECAADSDQVVLSIDHDQYIWIDPSDYTQYDVIDNLKPVLAAYVDSLH